LALSASFQRYCERVQRERAKQVAPHAALDVVHAIGSAGNPLDADEHAARFTGELARRVGEKICAEIVAMSRDLDRLDARRLGELLRG